MMGKDREARPHTDDPSIRYLFDSLERIESKLDRDLLTDARDHRNLYVWCAILSVAGVGGSGIGMHLLGLL